VPRKFTLLSQILAINVLLIATAVVVTTVVADLGLDFESKWRELLVLALAVLLTLLANVFLLRRRLRPLERLILTMEEVDLATPGRRAAGDHGDAAEVSRLRAAFNRMLDRLEAERRQAARTALRAQERERQRIAQDLHDEVNQALTAILLRLEATLVRAAPELRAELVETKRLAQQAMEELLRLSHELRPSALDDHGLLPALRAQVRDFSERTGIHAEFRRQGPVPPLSDDQQLVLYRITQEGLSNVAQHAQARNVDVELSFTGATVLRISDDGRGLPARRNGGHGLTGMHERALLVGGQLAIHSEEGAGTTITLTMG
jgi:two-component system sensor histidine kinase UhpB